MKLQEQLEKAGRDCEDYKQQLDLLEKQTSAKATWLTLASYRKLRNAR